MTRLRLTHLVIQPVQVLNDGEEFTTGPQFEAAAVAPSQLNEYMRQLRDYIEKYGFPEHGG